MSADHPGVARPASGPGCPSPSSATRAMVLGRSTSVTAMASGRCTSISMPTSPSTWSSTNSRLTPPACSGAESRPRERGSSGRLPSPQTEDRFSTTRRDVISVSPLLPRSKARAHVPLQTSARSSSQWRAAKESLAQNRESHWRNGASCRTALSTNPNLSTKQVAPSEVWEVATGERPLLWVIGASSNGDRHPQSGGLKSNDQTVGVTGGDDQLVVLTTAQRLLIRRPHGHGHMGERDANPRGVSQMTNVGGQAIGDVDGRRGPRESGRFPFGQSGHRSSVGLYQGGVDGSGWVTGLGRAPSFISRLRFSGCDLLR